MRGINKPFDLTERNHLLPASRFCIWPEFWMRPSAGAHTLEGWMQCSGSDMHLQSGAHLCWCNQHSCVAEAYKPRGRAFQGRKLRHLVTSKAGCNQASGSFCSAASCSRYAAGCTVGGRLSSSRTDDENTILAIFTPASRWSKDTRACSLTAQKRCYSQGFFDRLTNYKKREILSEGNLF